MQDLITKVMISAFATVGIIEYLKNFIKTDKKWIYSLIMPFISIGCYCICQYLPIGIIGGALTIGTVQLGYQLIIQGFKKIIEKSSNKIEGVSNE
jgi:hypothetical protein